MSLLGIWRSRGYGWILRLDAEGYALFDHTPLACIEIERGSTEDFTEGFDVRHPLSADHLALSVRHDISTYEFDRIAGLPADTLFLEACRRPAVLENFECFCEIFRQDYAFFELRGVEWEEICSAGRLELGPTSGQDELFSVLQSLIAPLKDNHVILSDGKRFVNSEKIPGVKALVRSELGLRSDSIGDPYNVGRICQFINQEFLGGNGKLAGNNVFVWGMLSPGIGYLNIVKLFGLSDTDTARNAVDLPPRRPDHARFLRDDLDAVESIMDRVMADLAECAAIIIDVRLNGGGFDCVGMAIANRFADKRRLAFTKQARNGTGVTPPQEFYIEPKSEKPYTRPVFLLTSARTASAGDIFALCMRGLPHVTLVGQPSTGILSDNLKKQLPNGWMTSISNEFYCSPDGSLFEGPGVPVDIETQVFVQDDFRAGYHLALDKALELAKGNRQVASGR